MVVQYACQRQKHLLYIVKLKVKKKLPKKPTEFFYKKEFVRKSPINQQELLLVQKRIVQCDQTLSEVSFTIYEHYFDVVDPLRLLTSVIFLIDQLELIS